MLNRSESSSSRRHELRAQLRRFILAELLEEPFEGDDPLAEGAVDSLGIEQLIDHIEQTYGVELGDEELPLEYFESLDALVSLVALRAGQGG